MRTPFSKYTRMNTAYLRRMASLDPMLTGYNAAHKEERWFNQSEVAAKRIETTMESIDRRWDLIEKSTQEKPETETGKDETK